MMLLLIDISGDGRLSAQDFSHPVAIIREHLARWVSEWVSMWYGVDIFYDASRWNTVSYNIYLIYVIQCVSTVDMMMSSINKSL